MRSIGAAAVVEEAAMATHLHLLLPTHISLEADDSKAVAEKAAVLPCANGGSGALRHGGDRRLARMQRDVDLNARQTLEAVSELVTRVDEIHLSQVGWSQCDHGMGAR